MIRHLEQVELAKLLPLSRQVNAIHEAEHPEPYRGDAKAEEVLGFFADRLEEGGLIFVAEEEGRICGFLVALPIIRPATPFLHASKHVELDQICVDEASRGKGIGKKLIEAMEAWMRVQGYREWKSMVHDFNQHSQNLMTGQGAQALGHRYRKEV